jgi:hypothetical protein
MGGYHNDKGQYIYYSKSGGCVITGNEDGVKHCAMGMFFALQHLLYSIPPQRDARWIGEMGLGSSYGDTGGDGKTFVNWFVNWIRDWNCYWHIHGSKGFKRRTATRC